MSGAQSASGVYLICLVSRTIRQAPNLRIVGVISALRAVRTHRNTTSIALVGEYGPVRIADARWNYLDCVANVVVNMTAIFGETGEDV
jgi:hypothetical protein